MDDRRDVAGYAVEKKAGCDCSGTCELAFKIAGTVYHYKNIWEKIVDEHFPECPTAVSARKGLKSTLCYCDKIEKAQEEVAAEEDARIEADDRRLEKGS